MMNAKSLKIRIFAVIALLVLLPIAVSAMGNSEKPYGAVLDESFADLAAGVDSGAIDVKDAVDELNNLRVANNRPESADYQEMEMLLTRLKEREMSLTQVREQVKLLEECKVEEPGVMVQTRTQNQNTVRTMTTDSGESKTSVGSTAGSAGGSAAAQGGSAGKK